VMPVYNADRFLRAAIESVLAQTFSVFEFLIYDDGSTDASVAIVREYALRDSRIRFFPMTHAGYVTWLNAGLQEATGEFVARMDADDVCLPIRFEMQHAFLRKHADVVVLGSDYLKIDEEGEALEVERHETQHEQMLAQLLAGGLGVIAHPTCMMRRVAALRVGGYAKRYETTEDLDMWLRLAEIGRLANLPEILLQYRHHGGNVGYSLAHRQEPLVDEIVNRARARYGLPPLPRSIWPGALDAYDRLTLWAWWAFRSGNSKTARKHARTAVALAPWRPVGWTLLVAAAIPRWLILFGVRVRRLLRRITRSPRLPDAT
jgi:Glycosyl transferase family 2